MWTRSTSNVIGVIVTLNLFNTTCLGKHGNHTDWSALSTCILLPTNMFAGASFGVLAHSHFKKNKKVAELTGNISNGIADFSKRSIFSGKNAVVPVDDSIVNPNKGDLEYLETAAPPNEHQENSIVSHARKLPRKNSGKKKSRVPSTNEEIEFDPSSKKKTTILSPEQDQENGGEEEDKSVISNKERHINDDSASSENDEQRQEEQHAESSSNATGHNNDPSSTVPSGLHTSSSNTTNFSPEQDQKNGGEEEDKSVISNKERHINDASTSSVKKDNNKGKRRGRKRTRAGRSPVGVQRVNAASQNNTSGSLYNQPQRSPIVETETGLEQPCREENISPVKHLELASEAIGDLILSIDAPVVKAVGPKNVSKKNLTKNENGSGLTTVSYNFPWSVDNPDICSVPSSQRNFNVQHLVEDFKSRINFDSNKEYSAIKEDLSSHMALINVHQTLGAILNRCQRYAGVKNLVDNVKKAVPELCKVFRVTMDELQEIDSMNMNGMENAINETPGRYDPEITDSTVRYTLTTRRETKRNQIGKMGALLCNYIVAVDATLRKMVIEYRGDLEDRRLFEDSSDSQFKVFSRADINPILVRKVNKNWEKQWDYIKDIMDSLKEVSQSNSLLSEASALVKQAGPYMENKSELNNIIIDKYLRNLKQFNPHLESGRTRNPK